MEQKLTWYTCDNCGIKLKTCDNHVDIVTEKSERDIGWQCLHVQIINHYSSHNDDKREEADLCQKCAHKLLADAAVRVGRGERVSPGVESADQQGFE